MEVIKDRSSTAATDITVCTGIFTMPQKHRDRCLISGVSGASRILQTSESDVYGRQNLDGMGLWFS